MFEMKNNNCSSCKHGYQISDIDYHPLCGAGYCYLCKTIKHIHCDKYELGDIPAGRERV